MNFVSTVWALLPPIIAIVFALKTKEVYLSLLLGIVTGTLLLTNFHIVESMNLLFDTVVNCLSKPSNIGILMFLVMLGMIVTLMTKSGGSQAYGKWASKIIRTKRSSLLLTSLLGCLIFLDDYFNCLTVGTVMKPITDRHHVSRAKLILKIQVLLTLNLKPLLRLFHTIFTPFLAFLWFFSSVSFPWILVLWQNRRY